MPPLQRGAGEARVCHDAVQKRPIVGLHLGHVCVVRVGAGGKIVKVGGHIQVRAVGVAQRHVQRDAARVHRPRTRGRHVGAQLRRGAVVQGLLHRDGAVGVPDLQPQPLGPGGLAGLEHHGQDILVHQAQDPVIVDPAGEVVLRCVLLVDDDGVVIVCHAHKALIAKRRLRLGGHLGCGRFGRGGFRGWRLCRGCFRRGRFGRGCFRRGRLGRRGIREVQRQGRLGGGLVPVLRRAQGGTAAQKRSTEKHSQQSFHRKNPPFCRAGRASAPIRVP